MLNLRIIPFKGTLQLRLKLNLSYYWSSSIWLFPGYPVYSITYLHDDWTTQTRSYTNKRSCTTTPFKHYNTNRHMLVVYMELTIICIIFIADYYSLLEGKTIIKRRRRRTGVGQVHRTFTAAAVINCTSK